MRLVVAAVDDDVPPSPKFQAYVVIEPPTSVDAEASNATVRGTVPDEGFYHAVLAGDLSGLDDRERIAVRYVQAMSLEPQGLAEDEALWAEVKALLSDAEIVDLTYCAAGWIGFGRAAHVLGYDRMCALPEPAGAAA